MAATRRISVFNAKGGVGKSTVTVNLAHGLASLRQRRVLIVDTDLQRNASKPLLNGVTPELTLYDVLYGKASVEEAVLEVRPGLDLLASDPTLDQAAKWLQTQAAGGLFVLSEALAQVESYDYVLFDHSPNRSAITESALHASSELLIPVELQPFAMEGVQTLLEWVQTWAKSTRHPGLSVTLVVPTKVDLRYGETAPYLTRLFNLFGPRLADYIDTDAAVVHAQGQGLTIFEAAPRSKAGQKFEKLVVRLDEDRVPAGAAQ